MCKTNKSNFLAELIKGIILGSHLLSFQKHGLIDKLLLEHVGLPHVLYLAVLLVNFFGWMSQGGYSEPLLLLALFYQSTPSCLKVMGGVGGPWDFSVSPSPFGLDFGTLEFGLQTWA